MNESDRAQVIAIGTVDIGPVRQNFPTTLACNPNRLSVHTLFLGSFHYRPEEVVEFTKRATLLGAQGVRIRLAHFPLNITFWCSNPEDVIQRIYAAGFIPQGGSTP